MFTGRRYRDNAVASVSNGVEDYCASPKRKDSKFSNDALKTSVAAIQTTKKAIQCTTKRSTRNAKTTDHLSLSHTITDYFSVTKAENCHKTIVNHDDKHSTDNIFLTEPVLSLNVKTPEKVSPFIKRSYIQNENNHSSFADISNGIVSIGIVESISKTAINEHIEGYTQRGSSICLILGDNTPPKNVEIKAKLAKPVTPHRIVCPSPEKRSESSDLSDESHNSKTRKK